MLNYILCALSLCIPLAFSKSTRQEILRRDNRKCHGPGPHAGILEASHNSHVRDDGYDTIERGEILCTRCHLKLHIEHDDNCEEELGLKPHHNKYAIRKIRERLQRLTGLSN